MKKLVLLLFSLFISFNITAGNPCSDKDKDLNKVTICHATGGSNLVNLCVDFAAAHGHLKNHSGDSIGECGTTVESLSDGIVYACNAGIKHEKPAARVCYSRTNPALSCNP